MKRLVGLVIFLASVRLLLIPVPFSNVLPALIVALLSLAYLEEDGLFLSIALFLAVANLVLDSVLVSETIREAITRRAGFHPADYEMMSSCFTIS